MANPCQCIPFGSLQDADLIVDAQYEGGNRGNSGDDPIHPLLGVGNWGGFRFSGSHADQRLKICVLYSELTDPDWPDQLHPETGQFVYFGDNKSPGHDLHNTPRRGNLILRSIFEDLHAGSRSRIPPIFVFTKAYKGRDVLFRGLAVPGAAAVGPTEDLIAVWKTRAGHRFQNYRAIFTILDVPRVPRAWIKELQTGNDPVRCPPTAWSSWVKSGAYNALTAPRTLELRERSEQVPQGRHAQAMLRELIAFFKEHPDREFAFERCAAEIFRMMDANVSALELTRRWRDGGRDGIGRYRIGTGRTAITVEFALEAKCKAVDSGSGVRDTARLIARLRHRQFGVFVTTSFVNRQAYAEILEDGHPVLILTGTDIVEILIASDISTLAKLHAWLGQFRSAPESIVAIDCAHS